MIRCKFRPATAQDAYDFYGEKPIFSFKGVVAVKDNEVVGIGGIYREGGHLVAFTDMKDEMRESKKDVALGCRMIHNLIVKEKRPVYAVANRDEPTAAALLIKLGFVPSGRETEMGDILVWEEK